MRLFKKLWQWNKILILRPFIRLNIMLKTQSKSDAIFFSIVITPIMIFMIPFHLIYYLSGYPVIIISCLFPEKYWSKPFLGNKFPDSKSKENSL